MIMPETTPTVVLVHGASTDASSFAAVVPEPLGDGLRVVGPAVPNRSLLGDAAYITSVIRQIDGPVILVGHSYGRLRHPRGRGRAQRQGAGLPVGLRPGRRREPR